METEPTKEHSEEGGESMPTKSSPTPQLKRKSSISEAVEESSRGWNAPAVLRWVELPFRIKEPSTGKYLPEATGQGMDAAGRGPLNQIGSYIGSALLRMASIDAGCPSPRGCTGTVYGLQPSSLLTLTSSVVGVAAAILMPIFGAIVDHTEHRKLVGCVSGFTVVLVTGMQIGISAEKNNWLYILILDAIQTFALLVHSTAVFAYLPDLTLDHSVLPRYTAHFNVRQFVAQLVVAGLVILLGQLRGSPGTVEAQVRTAKDGAIIAFSVSGFMFGYAWIFAFRKRPALSQVPEDSNLITTGFKQVGKTSRKIWKDYRALKWFMISLLFSPEAGAGVVLSIAVTFLVFVVKMNTLEIAQAALVLQVGNIVGSYFSAWICRHMTPLNSYRLALTLLGISMGVSAIVMDGPDRKNSVYGFASAWGFFMGWTYPSQRVLFVTLIPKGQETEMMGMFFFMGQILGWLPPLLFTIMNENGVDMRWGLGLITFFDLAAVALTLFMGSYEAAVALVAEESEAKLQEVLEAASKLDCKPASHAAQVVAQAAPVVLKQTETHLEVEKAKD